MSTPVKLPEGQEFFKLNEVCKLANVQPYMLRFWGTEFPQLEASRTGTGQRLYSREQVELILEVRRLLFDEGLTIAGARKKIAPLAAEVKAPVVEDEAPAPRKTKKRARKNPAKPAETSSEVDKKAGERVKHLESALRGIRSELATILREIKRNNPGVGT